MLKKLITVLTAFSIVMVGFVTPITSYADEVDCSQNVNFSSEEARLAEELSNYFELDENGNIGFSADKKILMRLGISEEDAELMTSIDPNDLIVSMNGSEGDIQPYGFVGLHLKLGPKIRAMNGIAAGAGAAATITASVAGVVGYAVKQGLRSVNVGVNIIGFSWSRTVNIP